MYCASLCAKGSDCQLLALSSASWSPSVPPVTSQASFTAFARLIPLRSSPLLCSLVLSLWRLATSLRAALPVSIPWSHCVTNSPWALILEPSMHRGSLAYLYSNDGWGQILFVPQGDHRVLTYGSACGDIAGNQRGRRNQNGDNREGQRI